MLGQLLTKVLGSQNDRDLKKLRPRVGEINAFEAAIKALSDEQLRAKTVEFRTRLANGETIDDVQAEAFAERRLTRPETPSEGFIHDCRARLCITILFSEIAAFQHLRSQCRYQTGG